MFYYSDDVGNLGFYMGDNFLVIFYFFWVMEYWFGEEFVCFDEVCVVVDWKSFLLLVECIKGNGYYFIVYFDWNVLLWFSFQEVFDFF